MKHNWQPVASREVLKQRARLLKRIRAFFDARDVLEVETPIVASSGSTDPHIDSLQTMFRGETYHLNTSPEYSMKRILADCGEPIYQVCKVFRDDELGPNHNPEFTMLEWYRPGFDMHMLMDEIKDLLACVLSQKPVAVDRMSYRQAFEKIAGIDPHQVSAEDCRSCAIHHNIEQPVGLDDNKDEWLDWLLTQLVMPSFETEHFTFIYDYPASQCSLARLREDEQGVQVASRFELFYGEVELANGFHELLSSAEQRQRFERENQQRFEAGKSEVKIDEYLLSALNHGLPDCSGVALGLDRLLMIMCEKRSIDEVLAFPFARA
jgi:lysyl-tRNA synthetase class 2